MDENKEKFEREQETEKPSYMRFAEKARASRTPEDAGPAPAEPEALRRMEVVSKPQPEPETPKPEEAAPKKELYYQETIKHKKKRGGMFRRVIAACAVVALVGGAGGGLGYAIGQKSGYAIGTAESGNKTPAVQTASSTYSAETHSAISVIKKVAPSVVNIKTVVQGQQQSLFYGYSIPYEAESAGSGVMFYEDDEKVYVATNNHVVEGATSIYVTVNNESEVPAKVIGTDSSADLAVISMNKSDLKEAGIEDVTLAVFGNSDNLEVGEAVIVIGNALGMGQTSTGGMVSALGKEISISGVTLNVIQTDAAINPGNSGGAMVNYNGEVVGIPTAKSFENAVEGMGYAIPSSEIVPIIEQLLEDGTVAKPYLGIAGENLTEEVSEMYNLPIGALVRQVVEGSAAEKAGLEKGDIIVGFNGKKIETMEELQEAVSKQEIGGSVEIQIVRGGSNEMTLTAVIQDANA